MKKSKKNLGKSKLSLHDLKKKQIHGSLDSIAGGILGMGKSYSDDPDRPGNKPA
jgi:hypothetical protein